VAKAKIIHQKLQISFRKILRNNSPMQTLCQRGFILMVTREDFVNRLKGAVTNHLTMTWSKSEKVKFSVLKPIPKQLL